MKKRLLVKNLKSLIWAGLILTFCYSNAFSQMSKGGIMILGFDGDGTDHLVLAILEEIPNNEIIYITDNEWNGTSWNIGEGFYTWTNNTGAAIPSGTIVTINVSSDIFVTAGVGGLSNSGATFSLTTSGDDIIIYQGSSPAAVPTNFITSFSSGPEGNHTLTGTGLTHGVDAIGDSDGDGGTFNNLDVLLYNGSLDCSGGNLIACSTLFATSSSFTTEDGSGDQSTNTVFPDIPTNIPPSGNLNGPLPVELIFFSVHSIENKTNKLRWQTASELNNMGFEIERSDDGTDWETINSVQGNGTTNIIQSYSFIDNRPLVGYNYYRLKQIDYDGKFEYSDIQSVLLGDIKQANMQVYPNPNDGQFTLSLFKPQHADASIRVYGMEGNLVWQEYIKPSKELTHWKKEMNLPFGKVYYVITYVNGEVISKKILAKNKM